MAFTCFAAVFVFGFVRLLRISRGLSLADPILSRAFCCAVSVLATSVVEGAETERRSYNLPAGDAARTLTLFAEASGKQIVFMTDNVRGEKTRAVAGALLPSEVISRMLDGTQLVAVQDAATGGYIVSRRQRSEAGNQAEKAQRSQQPPTQPPPMTSKKSTSALRALMLLLLAPALPAQTVQPSGSEPPPDKAIVLSPFEVNSTQDRGYAAQNTLAGSRVSTNLKDLPAPISVFNEQFLADIAAADLMQAIEYGVGTRPDLYETRADGPIGEGFNFFDRGIRIRGLPGGRRTRNYFNNLGEVDTYNKGRLEFSRGPNSILNGFGSPAGVINASTKQAVVNRRFTNLSFRFGDWDEQRSTLDANLPIVQGVLGLRLNYMNQNSGNWRDFGHNDANAVHLAGTWRIGDKTTVRFEGEIFDRKLLVPRPWIANDGISSWIAQGRPTYNPFRGTGRPGQPNSQFSQVPGVRNRGNRAVFIHNDNVGYDWSQLGYSGSLAQNVSNSFDFNLYHRPEAVLEGPGIGGDRDFYQYGASIERQLARDLFIEVSADVQHYEWLAHGMGDAGAFGLHGDPNQYLPTGEPNPHAGQFYMEQTLRSDQQDNLQKSLRATLSYERDFGDWWGHHRFALMGERRDAEDKQTIWREFWVDVSDPNNPTPPFNAAARNAANQVFRRVYFTDQQVATMRGVHWVDPFANPIGTIDLIDPIPTNPFRTRRLEARWAPAQSTFDRRNLTTAGLFVMQNYWLKKHLITFFGYRQETLKQWNSTSPQDSYGFLIPWGQRNETHDPAVRGITRNFGVVAKPPFRSLHWLSAFFNHATSASVGGGNNIFGPDGGVRPPAPYGETDDYGVKVDLFDGKVFFTVARYETVAADDAAGYTNLANAFERPLQAAIDAGIVTTAQFDAGRDGVLSSSDVLGGESDTFDSTSDGWEFELFLNPTRNLRMTLNYTMQDTARTNIAPRLRRIADSFKPLLLQGDTPYALLTQDTQTPGVERATSLFDPNDGVLTIAEGLREAELDYLEQISVFQGEVPNGHTRHRLNLFANYSFDEGRLKGFSVGVGARYRSGTAGGFTTEDFTVADDLATATSTNAGIDPSAITTRYVTDDELFFDLKLGYERRIQFGNRRIPWSIQLNVRNVLDKDELRITQLFLDGTPRMYRLGTPRQILVTNSIRF